MLTGDNIIFTAFLAPAGRLAATLGHKRPVQAGVAPLAAAPARCGAVLGVATLIAVIGASSGIDRLTPFRHAWVAVIVLTGLAGVCANALKEPAGARLTAPAPIAHPPKEELTPT